MRALLVVIAAVMTAYAPHAGGQTAAAVPDYSDLANWVCRPGAENVCTTGLDATVAYPDGHKVEQPFVPAKDPAVDCFYVYPTVSRQPTDYADMTDSPEVQQVTRAQAGRLSSRCRVFAPIYRQRTLSALSRQGLSFDQPLHDVEAAWAYYLKHDNHGRGVVLMGHSQGSILLHALIAGSIDGKPAQSLLVSAFLAGEPSLGVPPGKLTGGDFKNIPVCNAAAQTGCVYVWGSYSADDATKQTLFGHNRRDGLVSACAIPAAPSGGSGMLKFYHLNQPGANGTTPGAPASGSPSSGPPWVEDVQQLSGECRADSSGSTLRVTVLPGPSAESNLALLKKAEAVLTSKSLPGWGLHILDVSLLQGNMLDVLDAEIASWRKVH